MPQELFRQYINIYIKYKIYSAEVDMMLWQISVLCQSTSPFSDNCILLALTLFNSSSLSPHSVSGDERIWQHFLQANRASLIKFALSKNTHMLLHTRPTTVHAHIYRSQYICHVLVFAFHFCVMQHL